MVNFVYSDVNIALGETNKKVGGRQKSFIFVIIYFVSAQRNLGPHVIM